MTTFPTSLPPTEEVIITIDPAFVKQVLDMLISHSIPFRANFSFPSKEEPAFSPHFPLKKLPEVVKDEQTELWESIPQFIVDSLKKGNSLSIEEMASWVKLTPHAFKTKFITYYGKPFYQYYLEQRMKYASELLLRGYKSTEVAIQVGYGEKSIIKFTKMFHKHFGITPKKYQMSHSVKK
ncbi:helix-turn-helix domain-containing protein [Runella salmonicolor]|uniref:AraC family transcriptional regulator n=1 Tax=Runella salmonicolor TaxID=2950278 RepID=A0ABT1FXP0_9BACT|nr:AraC family transcriptional regulator [Runella salmonicolor]MCP1386544.1 AraC family transcriptional regulator [Runella salmonicolor]